MPFFTKNVSDLPGIESLPVKPYVFNYSLDKLTLGVDNVHYDVHLSPLFLKTTARTLFHLIAAHSKTESLLDIEKKQDWKTERDEFKRLCRDVLISGINRAKSEREIQIDFLAQTAVAKFLFEEIRHQFEILADRLVQLLRKSELARQQDIDLTIRLKAVVSRINQDRNAIIRRVSGEIFDWFMAVQTRELKEMREANFGGASILSKDILANPILHSEQPLDDFFMIKEYVLLGHRLEDPDRYEVVLACIRELLETALRHRTDPGKKAGDASPRPGRHQFDELIMQTENMDILFNCFRSDNQLKSGPGKSLRRQDRLNLKQQSRIQKKLLDHFFRKFSKTGLLKKIAASYEMQPLYLEYCPPLAPQQVSQFLTSRRNRNNILRQLQRAEAFYDKTFSLQPLRKKQRVLSRIGSRQKKKFLIRFLRNFARYHRDLENYKRFSRAIDTVNLATQDKIIQLSRANYTLYEFLLPQETVLEEKPIINHVILKADVRGSTDITYRMRQRGLNPASYFSLNLFDPITYVLSEYGAGKVFIEGDAMILSIFEHQDTPGGWYSVAQACGLAMKILQIVQRCNAMNRKHRLPILELGIGISYQDNPPTFLFDAENRIMISPAINLADRLAGCSKRLRHLSALTRRPFNLYVCQAAAPETVPETSDDNFLRYNVNGIELSTPAFKKLSREIDLQAKTVSISGQRQSTVHFHIGKFPTIAGRYKGLIIREGRIPEVSPDTLKPLRLTRRKYFEVCTHPKLYEYFGASLF